MVVDAGAVEVPGQRLRIEATGEFASPEDIGELTVRRSGLDTIANVAAELAPYARATEESRPTGVTRSGSRARMLAGELIRIKDVATVRQGYLEHPINQMRYQGQSVLAIQLAKFTGGNIVDTGAAIDARLEELLPELPAGIEVAKFTWQSDLVRESVNGFVINLAEAVLIVLVVLTLAMGWRMGLVIGWALIVTIRGTFMVMRALEIDLHRVSLGALGTSSWPWSRWSWCPWCSRPSCSGISSSGDKSFLGRAASRVVPYFVMTTVVAVTIMDRGWVSPSKKRARPKARPAACP